MENSEGKGTPDKPVDCGTGARGISARNCLSFGIEENLARSPHREAWWARRFRCLAHSPLSRCSSPEPLITFVHPPSLVRHSQL
jgi:hypothetical protein